MQEHIKIWLLVLAVAAQSTTAPALRFTQVQVPALVQRASNFWLACLYEQARDEQLYSVKWYKNNEEFYRLSPASSGADQQRHFSVPGVNVMMSQSNATHVRLLNASLESEGSYACEISTQNLSTIRHEREIRVYVLPASARPQIAGLKSRYALGERVELQCSSEAARPPGSLAWFINGVRVFGQQASVANSSRAQPNKLVEFAARLLEPLVESRGWRSGNLNEPQRLYSTLKFKLSAELLASLDEFAPVAGSGGGGGGGERNQLGRQRAPFARPAAQMAPLQPLLSLECKYKLTEVSEVTFGELLVSSGGGGTRRANWPPPPPIELERKRRRKETRRRRTSGATMMLADEQGEPLGVYRAAHNQILVRPAEANGRREHLVRALQPSAATSGACKAAALNALDPDDPVIVASDGGGAEGAPSTEATLGGGGGGGGGDAGAPSLKQELDADERHGERLLKRQAPSEQFVAELSVGSELRLNCTTIGALELEARNAYFANSRSGWQAPQAQATYCNDTRQLRRALISGKYQQAAASRARHNGDTEPLAAGHHLVAHLALSAAELSSAAARRRSSPLVQSGGGGRRRPPTGATLVERAPPLLEWFINNQEAPDSSAQYWPKLPLSVPSVEPQKQYDKQQGLTSGATDGAQAAALAVGHTELPAIDYQEYFANYAERPLEQHLELSLRLEKRHFETSDSLLRLRCSSTKAQVLISDSISIGIYAIPLETNDTPPSPTSGWQKRPVGGGRNSLSRAGNLNHRQQPALQAPSNQRREHAYARSSSRGEALALVPILLLVPVCLLQVLQWPIWLHS